MTSIPMTTDYVDVKVKIGAVEYTNEKLQIDSIKISNGCYDGSVFGIGNVYIKNASITMNYLDGISKGLNIEIFFQYQGAWISFGRFVVTETPVMSGDKLSVSLESTLAQYANTEIVFAEAKSSYNFDTIIKKIEEITGKVVVFKSELDSIGTEKSEFLSKSANFIKDAKTLMDPASGCKTGVSVKTALAGIAILFGGNVYEDTNNKIVIKQKTYSLNSDRYILPDYLDGNYKYSKEVYAIKTISLLFNKYVLGIYYRKETDPPGEDIWTQNYLDEDKVSNTLLASQSSMSGKTPYNYTVTCDWIGWTSDGFGYNLNETPGGRASACLRQGDLMYRTCDMTFVGIDFGWNIAPGNLVKVKVPELEDPIDVLCGEISYEWDGGFTTNISCNCNIESNGSYSTEVSTQASAAAAQEGRQTSLELNYANITLSNIEDSTIRGSIFKDGTIEGSKIKESTITGSLIANSTIKGSNIEEGTITGSNIKAATITGALIVDGTIRGNHIMESSIDGSKIEDSAITESKISNSSITNSKIKDGEIENSKIKDATLTGAKIEDATIGFEKVDKSFISDLTADEAYIENLKASIADIGYLTADEADIKYATIASLEVVDGKINTLSSKAITTENLSAKVADLGYLNADTADIAYAKIDFSNVGTQVVSSSMIIDGAVTNEKVANLSANKITSGTIDASKITVTNLNADNLTVGTINGKLIGNGSVGLDKLSQEVPTKEYLDSVQKDLQGQIDGAIETFTKSEIPTLNNEPASSWTDTETRKKHIGDVCYVLNPASSADGYCYRFANTGTEASPQYEWVLIKDSDVTKALQDIIDINGKITGIKQFDTEISSWKTDTDNELSSLKTRTTNLETDIGTKVSSTVFNEVKQTVDKNSASITTLSDTVKSKADGSTVEALTNTVNEVKQTADSNSSSISSMQTEIGKKADGSTVTSLETRTSKIEQNLDGFKTEVSKTYTTKTAFDNLEVGGRNICRNTNQGGANWWWSTQAGTYTKEEVLEDGVKTCKFTREANTVSGWSVIIFNNIGRDKWLPNTEYTLSVDIKASTDTSFTLDFYTADYTNNLLSKTISGDNTTKANEWTTLRWTFLSCNPLPTQTNQVVYLSGMNSDPGVSYQFRNLKLEKGNKATDWSPAPEDLESDSSAKADAALQSAKSYIDQTAESINQVVSKKVGDSEIISKINQSAEQITISADKLNLSGYLTISGADAKYDEKGSAKSIKDNIYTPNTTTIDGGKITANSIKASSIDVDNLFAQDITATGTITGATLKGVTAEIDAGKIGPLSIASDDRNLRFDLSDSYYLRIGGQIYGKGINIFDNSGFTQVIYSSSGIWMRDEKDAGWDTLITPSRITIGDFIHGTSTEGFEINIPTTVNDNLTVTDTLNTHKMETTAGIEMYHPSSTPYIDFHNTPYGQQDGSDYNFRIISLDKNVLDFENAHGSIFKIQGTEAYENGYLLVGCTVTTSGNFTCKKYRDGRLVIEYRLKNTSNVSLSNKVETYYATGSARTFPVAFTDVPAVMSGIAISDLSAPFCNVTFESVTKTGFGRYIIWTLPTISGYVIPSGSVVSATFTGRWK